MSFKIIYGTESYLKSFYKTLDQVARERVYIEMIEAPSWERISDFHTRSVASNWPLYYAIENDEVIGWADITPSPNPRMSHRGFLGMGILKNHRGKGVGSQLLKACLDHAEKLNLEKIELSVYSSNLAAIQLYKKFGFQQFGYIRHFRKLENEYFDCIEMEKFLIKEKI